MRSFWCLIGVHCPHWEGEIEKEYKPHGELYTNVITTFLYPCCKCSHVMKIKDTTVERKAF